MDTTWAYIAGIFDGEGNLYYPLKHNKGFGYNKRIVIAQSGKIGKQLLEFIKNVLQCGNICEIKYNFDHSIMHLNKDGEIKKYKDFKKQYRWTITKRRDINFFLKNVFPYLIIKRNQTKEVLQKIKEVGFKNSHWTKEEDNFIKNHYIDFSFRDVAEKLKRTHKAIRSRAAFLKIYKGRGGIQSQSHHRRLIIARRKRKDFPMLGKHHTRETIEKIKESNKKTYLLKKEYSNANNLSK